MTRKYTLSFRKNAVELLHDLSLDSCFTHDNIPIKNVRQLCVFLNISSNTLYRWQKEFSPVKSEKKDVSVERIECYAEDWCKAYQSEIDEVNPNCNMLEGCTGFKPLDDVAKELIFKDMIIDDGDVFDDIYYEKIKRIAEINYKEKMTKAYENGDEHESESDLIGNYPKKVPDKRFSKSIELNLIKAMYANRFGSSSDKTKAHMIRKLINAWRVK